MLRKLPLYALIIVVLALYSAQALAQEPLVTNTPSPTPSAQPTLPTGTIFITVPMTEAQETDGIGLEIDNLEIERTLNTIERVIITARNTSDAPVSGAAWFVLAPAYIQDEPWRQAAYIAPIELITDLAPGETVELAFGPAPESANLIGEYKLSGWLHTALPDGTTQHADGLGFEVPIVVGPPLFLTVDHVELAPAATGAADEQLVFVTFTLRNYTPQFAEVAFSYSLAKPGEERPWETGIFSSAYQSLILLPGSTLTLTARDVLALPAGETLQATGYLQQNENGTYVYRSSYTFPTPIGAAG